MLNNGEEENTKDFKIRKEENIRKTSGKMSRQN